MNKLLIELAPSLKPLVEVLAKVLGFLGDNIYAVMGFVAGWMIYKKMKVWISIWNVVKALGVMITNLMTGGIAASFQGAAMGSIVPAADAASVSIWGTTTAVTALNIAISMGIGAIIMLIIYIVTHWEEVKKSFASTGPLLIRWVLTPLYKIADGFVWFVNLFVKGINAIIDVINLIPGVKLGKLAEWKVPTTEQRFKDLEKIGLQGGGLTVGRTYLGGGMEAGEGVGAKKYEAILPLHNPRAQKMIGESLGIGTKNEFGDINVTVNVKELSTKDADKVSAIIAKKATREILKRAGTKKGSLGV